MTIRPNAHGSAPDLLTVKLEKLVYGGDALGRLPDPLTEAGGRAVFVPFGLPGETVSARAIEEKRGHVRAELVEVLEPSPERISPRCKHFGICGGCHYQHLPYQAQLQAKTEILRDQLARIGKIENPPVKPMISSSHEWNYRNHIQFHLTHEGKLGYVTSSTDGLSPSESILAVTECHLPKASLNDLWPRLEFDPGLGLERVSLRLGAGGETMLVLESGNPEPPELELEADLSVVHLTEGDMVVMAGDKDLVVSVNNRSFRVSAASFFQVNTGMAGEMVEHLLDNLPVTQDTTLLDVYCGVGLFSAFFAPRAGRVIGIESSPSACEDFTANLAEFENVELYEAPAEAVLPALDVIPDAVIVDPPRAGLEKRALDALLAQGPERVAYVSCDPSTLSRDVTRLIHGGYRLVQVTPFDLFPQTCSIESISILEKG
jgi:23S rRNA (uracil1939-C5)-methyltransferase